MRPASACALLLAAAVLWIAGSLPALAAPASARAAADALPAVEHNPPGLLHLAAGRPPAPRNPISLRKAPGKPSGKTVKTSPKKETTGGVSGIKPHKAKAPKTTTAASVKKPVSAKEKQTAAERLGTARQHIRDGIARRIIDQKGLIDRKSDSVTLTIRGDQTARARVETTWKGQIRVTDVYRGYLPKGTGGIFLGRAIKEHGHIKNGTTFLLHNIRNDPTVAAFKNRMPASQSVLGKMTERALAQLGLTPKSMVFIHDGRHLNIEVKLQ